MGSFIKGDVITVPFPYSNLKNSKKRPAFVIQEKDNLDITICPITRTHDNDNYAIKLNNDSFLNGTLNIEPSFIRCNFIVTIDKGIVLYKIGNLKAEKVNDIIEKIIEFIKK